MYVYKKYHFKILKPSISLKVISNDTIQPVPVHSKQDLSPLKEQHDSHLLKSLRNYSYLRQITKGTNDFVFIGDSRRINKK